METVSERDLRISLQQLRSKRLSLKTDLTRIDSVSARASAADWSTVRILILQDAPFKQASVDLTHAVTD